ncbi:HNH endonuclease [Vibrio vulnificus]|uniref:HNH endonuclease n=1 Tax=Vibrio vulnificus TaxID=672 RepID=UPI001EE9AF26
MRVVVVCIVTLNDKGILYSGLGCKVICWMNFWIFKLSKQNLYPDVPGKQYVFDNTHSVKVASGDAFIFLDKTKDYSFTAVGTVSRLEEREPTEKEASRTKNVRTVYTAHLSDVYYFEAPLCIDPQKGKDNRKRLGIVDVNLLGWSHSMAKLCDEMFNRIIDLACESNLFQPLLNISNAKSGNNSFEIKDQWGLVKRRAYLYDFSRKVKSLCKSQCVVCGLNNPLFLDAAHIIPYAIDKKNRANPSNGICLCKHCHVAYDNSLIDISYDGELAINDESFLLNHKVLLSKEMRFSLVFHASEFLTKKAMS